MRPSRVPLRLPRDEAALRCEYMCVRVLVLVLMEAWRCEGDEARDGCAEVVVDAG